MDAALAPNTLSTTFCASTKSEAVSTASCAPTVYNHFKRIVKEIGLPEVRFHDMRHTFAVLSLQNGDDIKTVQANVGHATAAFTLDVYGHVSQKMQKDSATGCSTISTGFKPGRNSPENL